MAWFDLVREELKAQGGTVIRRRGGHEVWRVPGVARPIPLPIHPGARNISQRILRQIKQATQNPDRQAPARCVPLTVDDLCFDLSALPRTVVETCQADADPTPLTFTLDPRATAWVRVMGLRLSVTTRPCSDQPGYTHALAILGPGSGSGYRVG